MRNFSLADEVLMQQFLLSIEVSSKDLCLDELSDAIAYDPTEGAGLRDIAKGDDSSVWKIKSWAPDDADLETHWRCLSESENLLNRIADLVARGEITAIVDIGVLYDGAFSWFKIPPAIVSSADRAGLEISVACYPTVFGD